MRIPPAIRGRGQARYWWVPVLGRIRRLGGPLVRRLIDGAVAAALLILLSPLLSVRALHSRLASGRVLHRRRCIGRFQIPFDELGFEAPGPGRNLPLLVNILSGSMSLAGPRAMEPAEASALPGHARDRYLTRPGVMTPFAIRSRIGIAFETELDTDLDYVHRESTVAWLGVIGRGLFGMLLGRSGAGGAPPAGGSMAEGDSPATPETSEWLEFFGVRIANLSMDQALDELMQVVARDGFEMVNFVNPHCLNVAWGDDTYRHVLDESAFILPDGIGLHQGCRILGCHFNSNINGTDLFPRLCERLAAQGRSVYLLGAAPGAAQRSAEVMAERFPSLVVAGARDGYFSAEEEAGVIARINESGADVLLVAMGVPRQEIWLWDNRQRLAVSLAMGVGGLFDYYSGRIPRAPQWVREIGMEWVWRLIQEPRRMWRRYLLGNFLFLYRVWKQANGSRR